MRPWTRTLLTAAGLLLASAPASAQFAFGTTGYPVGAGPDATAVGDINGDGDHDLVVTSDAPDKVSVLMNGGNGTFAAAVNTLLGGGTAPHTPVTADFDNDGDVDVAVSLKNVDMVQILVNNAGVLVPGPTFPVGPGPIDMATGDIDRDFDMDIVVVCRNGNSVFVLRNNGGLSFTPTGLPAGSDPRDLDLGDVTGDGLLDIAVASHGTDQILIFRNVGGGAFVGNPPISTAPRSPSGVVLARLDANGTVDVGASGSNGGVEFAMVSLNAGGGAFGAMTPFVLTGVDAGTMDAADFDGDGDNDLAIENRTSNDVSLLQNSGAGTFGPDLRFPVGVQPGHVVATFLDKNTVADLVVTNETTGSVSVMLNGAGSASPMLSTCHPGDEGVRNCPCGNAPRGLGRGCENSANTGGARLTAAGTASVAGDSLVFTTSGERATALSLVLQGTTTTPGGVSFGQGVRCFAGNLKRLYAKSAVAGSITAPQAGDPSVTVRSAALGNPIAGGQSRFHIVYYRDPIVLGGCSPTLTFNGTQGGTVVWAP